MRNAGVRTVHWGIRLMLLVGTAFVTFDFVQLTFLAERTDRYFSWTIDAPITAVVLGSFYFAAIILTLFGERNGRGRGPGRSFRAPGRSSRSCCSRR